MNEVRVPRIRVWREFLKGLGLMKQLFSASLTWGESVYAVGTDLSSYTDEEHLSGNRKRLGQLSKSAIPSTEIKPDDPRVITGDLPVMDFAPPPAVELRSGLSGSFPRQNSGQFKMRHWTEKKLAGSDAWDARVSDSVKEYEKNSRYTTSSDCLPLWKTHKEGESFIEFDTHEETPAIEQFARGEAKMLTDFNGQNAGRRMLHKPMKMLECQDGSQTAKPIEPSNSFDMFSSFVGYKATDAAKNAAQDAFAAAMYGTPEESFAPPAAESNVIELIVVTEEPIEIHDDLDVLIAECIAAARSYEELTAQFDSSIAVTQAVITCAPRMSAKFNVIDNTGNIAITVANSVAINEMNNVAGYVQEELNFDPKSFAFGPVDMDSVDEVKGAEIEIESLTLITTDEYDTADFSVAVAEPSRRTKGSSRSRKAQARREKRSKKRDTAVSVHA